MQYHLYSFYDLQSKTFAAPYSARTHGEAERIVKEIVTDPNTQISRHPADFHCYHIGTVEDSTGEITPVSPIHMVAKCIDLVPKTPIPNFESSGLDETRNKARK